MPANRSFPSVMGRTGPQGGLLLAVLLCAVSSSPELSAQQPVAVGEGESVRIQLAPEVEIKALVDYVSERTGVPILYDEKLANKKISIRAPREIPVTSLLSVLESALRIKGMALVDADTPGWKQVIENSKLAEAAVSEKSEEAVRRGSNVPVTQVFVLQHIDPTTLDTTLKPFLTQPGGNSVALKDQNVLIVTDYATTVTRLARLVEAIDRPRPEVRTEYISLSNTDADSVATRITTMLDARAKAQGTAATPGVPTTSVFAEDRTNTLIVFGDQASVADIRELVKRIDIPLPTTTEVYNLKHVSADRIDRLAKSFAPARAGEPVYQSVIDQEGNMLIVTTTAKTHEQIANLLKQLDVSETAENRSRIRFYKLKHITAADALETIRDIEGGGERRTSSRAPRTDGRYRIRDDGAIPPGPNRAQLGPATVPPRPPAYQETRPNNPASSQAPFPSPETPDSLPQRSIPPATSGTTASPREGEFPAGTFPVAPRAQITADYNANTLIVVADPVLQQTYAELIRMLDRPRPQVLIEAKIVILDTTDDFSLGVEVSGGDRQGTKRLFAFSSHGLSTVNPVNGALSILPGLGFNGTLVNPEVADVVLRAFTRHDRAKVLSAPRVLVNDNATGLLTSVTEVPFTSVNASQTVATTSFAGFAEAGTTISVTPHISDDDQLQLEYLITLNSFQGAPSAAGVPPTRQTQEIDSEVTVPDGHTLIVGGLNQMNASETINSIPFLENIPIVKQLASSTIQNTRQTSLFIFLRPVILRDDKFRDLKYYSERDISDAAISEDHPASYPILIR